MATKKIKPLDIRDGHPRVVLVMTPAPTPLEPGKRIITSYRVNFDDPFTEADIIASAVQGMVGALTAGAIQLGMGAARAEAAKGEADADATRLIRELKAARRQWTDLTMWVVFLAGVVGAALVADALTPLPLRNLALARYTDLQKAETATLLWLFVALAHVRLPHIPNSRIYGGMAAGIFLCLIFGEGALHPFNWFGLLFWTSLAVAIVATTINGIRDGTLIERGSDDAA